MYWEEKCNPVKHMMAIGSISWQGNRKQKRSLLKKHDETTQRHDMLYKAEALPMYPTNC